MNIMRMKTALLVLFACIVALWLEIPVTAQRPQQPDRLVQYPARGTRGAVAAGTNYATEAGMRMFYTGRQRGGRGRGDYFRGGHHGIRARGLGRGSAHPDPHERRQGAFHRGRRHDAEAGHSRLLPQPAVAVGRDSGSAGAERTQGHGPGGRDHVRAGAGHAGRQRWWRCATTAPSPSTK